MAFLQKKTAVTYSGLDEEAEAMIVTKSHLHTFQMHFSGLFIRWISEVKDLELVLYIFDFRQPACLHSFSRVFISVLLRSFYSLSVLSEHPPQCFS